MKLNKSKLLSFVLVLAVIIFTSGFFSINFVEAAAFTGMSDTMTSQATSTTSDHTITWTLASGHTTAVGATITIDFVHTDIVPSGTWQTSDFAFTDNVRSAAAPASVGTGAASCSGSSASNYIVNVTAATGTFVITTCTGWTTSAATTPTTFKIFGTASSGTGLLTNKATDVTSSVVTITDSGNDTDSGSVAIAVEDNSVVSITATVNPTLTFSNDDAAIGFGTLTSASAVYANAGATGSGSDGVANTFTIATNGTSGYTLTYNGANLTSGSNTIPTANGTTTISNDANGTPGTAEWAMSGEVTGSGSMASGYNHASGSGDWKFVPSATTTLASHTAATSDSITMHYLANIASTTPSGSYSTSITFIATGNF